MRTGELGTDESIRLMDTLEPTAQRLLEKDPNNPNTPKTSQPVARPGMGFSRSATGAKPSLKETMLAQKKALATKNHLPARPGSAMAHFSPSQSLQTGYGTTNVTWAGKSQSNTTTRQKPGLGSGGGLSGAPMRPSRRRPELAPRPATAGPYSFREDIEVEPVSPPPPQAESRAVTPRATDPSPRRTLPSPGAVHRPTGSKSSIPTPSRRGKSPAASPTKSPRQRLHLGPPLNSPRMDDDVEMSLPPSLHTFDLPTRASPRVHKSEAHRERISPASPTGTPSRALRVYEDPLTAEQSSLRLTPPTVLEEKPINADAASLFGRQNGDAAASAETSPEKARQHARLIDSALAKIDAKALDVHGFRKLQGIIRDNKATLPDDKFEALVFGLFDYLEDPLSNLTREKVQDVKAQVLATIRLLLRKHRDHFQPHISKGLESLMSARASYDARTHIVSGLELLADELVMLGDAQEIATVLTRRMSCADDAADGRSLSMGLHVLKEMVDAKRNYVPTETELRGMSGLCTRCLESSESGVRMDAVQLCVALHSRVGDARFWEAMKDVKDDPKSLITYYIVKRQRERGLA